MAELEKEEILKKIIEPQQREPKKEEENEANKAEESIKKSKHPVTKQEAAKKEPSKNDKHINEKILLFVGIPATILLAIIIQYLYHNYYVIPLQERTLINVVKLDITQSPWITRINGATFSLIHDSGLKVQFEYMNKEDKNSEFYWIKGNEYFSRIALSDSLFEAKVLFTDSDWEISLSAENSAIVKQFRLISSEEFHFSNGSMIIKKHRLVTDLEVSTHGIKDIAIAPGKEVTLKFLSKEITNVAFSERLAAVEADYDEQFNSVFQLKSKAIPEFYQNMGKSALSSVLSALYTEERVFAAAGDYNFWFLTPKLPFTHLHLPEGCEDFRTQGLAALAIIDLHPIAVLQLITSWTNLVNTFGKMPANVSSIADYKTKIVPSLFAILDEYINKNGILPLKPIYSNIEKIGLAIVSLNQNNKLFSTTKDSYFFEKPKLISDVQIYTVELHAILVKASRILVRLSSEYGDRETVHKFLQLNEIMEKPEVLKEYQNEASSHADFSLKIREGKEYKEFIPDSESLSPIIFQLLASDSKELEIILARLSDPKIYWSNYGIRTSEGVSVAQNFMILKALNYYSQQSGPSQGTAHSLYARLRNNLIMFVAQEFKKTKTFWEYYSVEDGHGFGRKNWLPSSTILKIMAELY